MHYNRSVHVKSFHLKGLNVDIHAVKMLGNMVRLTIYINGKEVEDAPYIVPEAELDEAVKSMERSFRENLTY